MDAVQGRRIADLCRSKRQERSPEKTYQFQLLSIDKFDVHDPNCSIFLIYFPRLSSKFSEGSNIGAAVSKLPALLYLLAPIICLIVSHFCMHVAGSPYQSPVLSISPSSYGIPRVGDGSSP